MEISKFRKLAMAVVDSWDLETLVGYAVDQLTEIYRDDEEVYEEVLKDYSGEIEDDVTDGS